ncbi:hypothetical protein GBA52_014931 [Prunus armeniaca]|nr:hypothetical protein GBA52_014931 [Prunus armeniaca]
MVFGIRRREDQEEVHVNPLSFVEEEYVEIALVGVARLAYIRRYVDSSFNQRSGTIQCRQVVIDNENNVLLLGEKFKSQKIGEIYEHMNIMSRGLYTDEFHEVENIVLSRWDKTNISMHCLVFALTPRFYDTRYLSQPAPVGDKSDTTAMIARNRTPNQSSYAQLECTGSNDRSGRISGSDQSGKEIGSDLSSNATETD